MVSVNNSTLLRVEISSLLTMLSHCDTCKVLSGGASTMNQIIPKSQLKITQGGEPAVYTYYGDSGEHTALALLIGGLTIIFRQRGELLLLSEVHNTYLPPPNGDGSRHHHCPDCSSTRSPQEVGSKR